MSAPSLLWTAGERDNSAVDQPSFFVDLNLDQIVKSVIAGKAEYDLEPLFRQPLHSAAAIAFRQAAMREVQREDILPFLTKFASALHDVRETLAQGAKFYYKYQKEASLLDAASAYCSAVVTLEADLSKAVPQSGAFRGFHEFLKTYLGSDAFLGLRHDVDAVASGLQKVRYTLLNGGGWITVAPYLDESDYEAEIEDDFRRFQQGDVAKFKFKFTDYAAMNHIEAAIVDRLARIYPDAFAALDDFGLRHDGFAHANIVAFDREAQFYISYHQHIAGLIAPGLSFCLPDVVEEKGDVYATGAFDLALAPVVANKKGAVVANDFTLADQERIILVSGPNQGGKTTFARMFGQLHYLAALGLPIPGASARLCAFDRIFTHFEAQENLHDLRGKLYDDLYRLRATLNAATPRSLIVLNEVFNSTSLNDAVFLSTKILQAILKLDALCVCVTFLDDLASLSDRIVSMASTVNPERVAERTFKVIRKPPDGLAYAISIAEKHRLTYRQLLDRL
jgi:hypothetical protein